MEPSPRHQAAAIYGTIISGSVMAAAPQDSVLTVVVLVLVTVFVYWLAERYADLLGAYAHGHHLTRADVRHSFHEGMPLIRASYAPLLVLVVSALLGADTRTALTIAMGFTIVWLFLMGYIAGRRRGVTGWPLVIVTGAAGLFGIVLMILKLALH